jgi:low affinity Fe/Cu permease
MADNTKASNGDRPQTDWFSTWATKIAHWAGKPSVFCGAALIVLVWAVLGPIAGFSDFWQLTINTGTTIVTFLMVFLIQNTQNRDSAALQIKLDELIRATKGAHNSLLDLEELSQDELEKLRRQYEALAIEARKRGLTGIEEAAEEVEEVLEEHKEARQKGPRRGAAAPEPEPRARR